VGVQTVKSPKVNVTEGVSIPILHVGVQTQEFFDAAVKFVSVSIPILHVGVQTYEDAAGFRYAVISIPILHVGVQNEYGSLPQEM